MTRNRHMVGLVFLTFFVMSLLTNILGPIVPDIISSFHVSLTAAGFLAFAFFIAYGVMSIPAGFLVERFTEKPVMILAFLVGALGSLSFALFPQYRVAIVSLFVIGAGMATLQVAVNPLLRVAGGEEHYAFNSTLAQLVFGSASFISPRIYSYLVLNLNGAASGQNVFLRVLRRLTPPGLPWASMYWIFAASIADGGSFIFFEVPERSVHRRRKRWIVGNVSQPGAPQSGLDVLYRHVRLRWLRARYGGLDLKISLPVPWFRSSYHGRNCGFLVLGAANGGLFRWHVAAKNI